MEVPSTVNLNIGGHIYTTTIKTLTQYPNSLFTSMFQDGGVPVVKDPRGSVFIDHDGNNFRFVLNFLRTSELHLPRDFQDFKSLAADAEFYGLPNLKKAIENHKELKNETVEFLHVTFYAHTKTKFRCRSGAHLWQKVVIVAPEKILLEVFPDNGKAIQEKAIYTSMGLNLMAGYGFSGTGILTIPSQYGRLQENVASLEFHSPDDYENGFGVNTAIIPPLNLSAHKYHICPDFHKYLLAVFSKHGFKLKGISQSNTSSNSASASASDMNHKQMFVGLPGECIGPHVQNFEWYFIRK